MGHIPANTCTLGASLTPAGWKIWSHAVYTYRPNSHAWLKVVAALFDTMSQIMLTQTNVRNDKGVKDYFEGVPIRKALETH